jgi:hypothetical protein
MKNIIETTSIIEFQKVFETYQLCEYECLYISIGSKYNQKMVEYKTLTNSKYIKETNAQWQMLPGFVQYKKTISICIDRFENKDIKQQNTTILKEFINPNTTFIICDLDGTIQLFEEIIHYIITRLNICSIHKDKFIIVNYLKFINPNHTEAYLESKLSLCIQNILSKTAYNNCLYEWFGYQPNLYNIIYRYNCRSIYYLLPIVVDILQKNIHNNEFTIFNITVLFGKTINTEMLRAFLKNIYDITLIDSMKSFYEYNQFAS